MIFGKYNPHTDFGIHILLSLLISFAGFSLDMYGIKAFLVCLALGAILDVDHLLNRPIAKLLNIESYHDYPIFGSYGSQGYTIKILHGFDIELIIAGALFMLSNNAGFAVVTYINLCVHELWDFLVYPHTWKELFLITRAFSKFKPGTRKVLTGIFFDISSLKY